MKVLLPFSGGLDSTAALFLLAENGHSVVPLTLDYGQKCGVEIERAAQIARFANTRIHTETIMGQFPPCSRVNEEIQVPACFKESDSSIECAVPGLYWQIIASSIRQAHVNNCKAICLPFTFASSQFYPEFDESGWKISSAAIMRSFKGEFKVIIPFLKSSKITLLRMLSASGAPYWITHSCLEVEEDCGKCPKCAIRESLFREAKSIATHHYG